MNEGTIYRGRYEKMKSGYNTKYDKKKDDKYNTIGRDIVHETLLRTQGGMHTNLETGRLVQENGRRSLSIMDFAHASTRVVGRKMHGVGLVEIEDELLIWRGAAIRVPAFVVVGHLAIRSRLGNHAVKIGGVAGTRIDTGDGLLDSWRGDFVAKKVIRNRIIQVCRARCVWWVV